MLNGPELEFLCPIKLSEAVYGALGVTDSCRSAVTTLSYANSVFSLCPMNYGASRSSCSGTVITGWSVALTCYTSHTAKHTKMADFDLSGAETP